MAEERIKELKRLHNHTGIFADRSEAGAVLSELVAAEALCSPLVMAIPAGGIPVAVPLAEALGCTLDVAVVSKITLPWNSEVGCGAVAFDNSVQLNNELIKSLGLSDEVVSRGIESTRDKVARRLLLLRGKHPLPVLSGRDLVVVDDGLASGFTMLVAVAALRRSGAQSITVAVPTGQIESVRRVAAEVRAVCCANLRTGYPFAVAAAYRRWTDVSEAQAKSLLDAAYARQS